IIKNRDTPCQAQPAGHARWSSRNNPVLTNPHRKEQAMLQRARGTIALLSGFLLAGSYPVQASSGLNSDPTALAQEPVSVSTPSPASIPSASSIPGATEAAKVQPPRPRDKAEAKILSVLDALDHYREGTSVECTPRRRPDAASSGRGQRCPKRGRARHVQGTRGSGSAWH